ncbi:hypothetical protein MMC17_006497 [Xylographa soralifera]|nr:hypothetical protein [Xylographa soralifera]
MQILITGATGGLGASVLSHLHSVLPPTSTLIASSSRPSTAPSFIARGIKFRHADYSDPATLRAAFTSIGKLLFVSSNTFDNALRTTQHRNVIEAAKAAGVGHIYYTSLAFGGHTDTSQINVMAAHLATEAMLRTSGLRFTSVREGVYAEAFPLFLDWYPGTEVVQLPGDGPMAFASRAELGEATANLMLSGEFDGQEVVLLSGPWALTLSEVAKIVAEETGRPLRVEIVEGGEEYVRRKVEGDVGRKSEFFFRSRVSWYEGIEKGDAGTMSGTLREVLGREPRDGGDVIRGLLRESKGEYTWHQNYKKA